MMYRSNTRAVQLLDDGDIIGALNAFNWTQSGLIQGLEGSVLHNGAHAFCIGMRGSVDNNYTTDNITHNHSHI